MAGQPAEGASRPVGDQRYQLREITRDQGLLYPQVPASVPRRRYDQNSSAANGSAAYVQTSVALPSWTCMTWTSLS